MPVLDDEDDEDDETFGLTLDNPVHAIFPGGAAVATATATIEDDDLPVVVHVAFAGSSYSVAEGDVDADDDAIGVAVVITLDDAPEREVAVPLTHAGANGATAADYSGVPATVVFGAAQTSATIHMVATDDAIAESGEEVRLTLGPSSTDGVETGAPATATVRLLDNDVRGVDLSEAELAVAEGAGGNYTVVLTSEPTAPVTVTVDGTDGTDVSPSPAALTFTATDYASAQTVTLSVGEDDDALADDPVVLEHSATGGDYGGVAIPPLRVVIEENDVPTLELRAQAVTVSEAAGVAQIVVALDGASSKPVAVSYETADGTAEDGPDYLGTAGVLTFPAGRETLTLDVHIAPDDEDDAETETFTVTFVDPVGGKFADAVESLIATVTITDDDLPEVAVRFGSTDYVGPEGGDVVLAVHLEPAPERQVVVPLAAAGVAGASAADYSGVPEALTFGAADTVREFTVVVAEDDLDDDDEQVSIRLGSLDDTATEGFDYLPVGDIGLTIAAGATSASATFTIAPVDDAAAEGGEAAVVTGATPAAGFDVGGARLDLRDDDRISEEVRLSVSPSVVPEGSAAVPVTVTATLDGTARGTATVLTVAVGATGDSAVSGTDYATVPPVALTIAANATAGTATFTFTPTADDAGEGGESASVSGVVDGGGLAVVDAVLHLADADRASSRVGLSLSPGGVGEADAATSVTVTATLDAQARDVATLVTVRVGWAPPRVLPTQDVTTVHLADDDERGVTVSDTDLTVPEDGSASYTVVLDSEPAAAVVVTPGLPEAAGDLSLTTGALTFTASTWETAQTVTVAAVADADAIADPSVTLSHDASGGGYESVPIDAVQVTITENDTPVLSVTPAATVAEAAGALTVVLALDRQSDWAGVAYETQDGTAQAPGDYAATGGLAVFDSASTSFTFTVAIHDDAVDEAESETFSLVLSEPQGLSFTDGATTFTVQHAIRDDDLPAVRVSYSQAVYAGTEGSSAAVTVVVDRDPEGRLEIPLTHQPGTGVAAADYGGVPGQVVFGTGVTEQSFNVAVTDNDVDQDGKTVTLGFGDRLPSRAAAGTPATASLHLADNDTRGVSVAATDLLVTEGATATYGIALRTRPTSAARVTVTVPTAAELAVSPSTLTFAPDAWATALSFTVAASHDDDAIGDAAVTLTHSVAGGDYAAASVDAVRVTVIEDDLPAVDVTRAVTVSESAGAASFAVTLDRATDKAVTVAYATADGSAVAPGDYTAIRDTLTFAARATSQTLAVAIVDDTDDEADAETFELQLSRPANARLKGQSTTLTATATISDDDDPEVTVAFETAVVVANEGQAGIVAVVVDQDPQRTLVIPVLSTPGLGATTADYSGVPGSVTFTAGGTRRQTFSVMATDDDVDDDGETVALRFGTLPPRVEAGDPATSTVHLGDNDSKSARVQASVGGGRDLAVVEGGTASYGVTLSSKPSANVVVTVDHAPGTDLSTSGALTFTPGDWSVEQPVTVTAAEDDDALDDDPITLTHTLRGGGYDDVDIGAVDRHDHRERPSRHGRRTRHHRGGRCRHGGLRGDARPGRQHGRDRGLRDVGRHGHRARRLHPHRRHADGGGRRPDGHGQRAGHRRQRVRGPGGDLRPGAGQPHGCGLGRGRERVDRDRDAHGQRRPGRDATLRERRVHRGGGRRNGGAGSPGRGAEAAGGGAPHRRALRGRDGGGLFGRGGGAYLRRDGYHPGVHGDGGGRLGGRRRGTGVHPTRPAGRHRDRRGRLPWRPGLRTHHPGR